MLIQAASGEYVISTKAVNKYGQSTFDAYNKGRIPAFASGGLIGKAAGGAAGLGSNTGLLGIAGTAIAISALADNFAEMNDETKKTVDGLKNIVVQTGLFAIALRSVSSKDRDRIIDKQIDIDELTSEKRGLDALKKEKAQNLKNLGGGDRNFLNRLDNAKNATSSDKNKAKILVDRQKQIDKFNRDNPSLPNARLRDKDQSEFNDLRNKGIISSKQERERQKELKSQTELNNRQKGRLKKSTKERRAANKNIKLQKNGAIAMQGLSVATGLAAAAMIYFGDKIKKEAEESFKQGNLEEGKKQLIRGERLKSAGQGVLAGGAAGALVGSIIPVLGTAIGTVVGGIIGGFIGLLLGNKKGKNLAADRIEKIGFDKSFSNFDKSLKRITERDADPITSGEAVIKDFNRLVDNLYDARENNKEDFEGQVKGSIADIQEIFSKVAQKSGSFKEFLEIIDKEAIRNFSALTNVDYSEVVIGIKDQIETAVKAKNSQVKFNDEILNTIKSMQHLQAVLGAFQQSDIANSRLNTTVSNSGSIAKGSSIGKVLSSLVKLINNARTGDTSGLDIFQNSLNNSGVKSSQINSVIDKARVSAEASSIIPGILASLSEASGRENLNIDLRQAFADELSKGGIGGEVAKELKSAFANLAAGDDPTKFSNSLQKELPDTINKFQDLLTKSFEKVSEAATAWANNVNQLNSRYNEYRSNLQKVTNLENKVSDIRSKRSLLIDRFNKVDPKVNLGTERRRNILSPVGLSGISNNITALGNELNEAKTKLLKYSTELELGTKNSQDVSKAMHTQQMIIDRTTQALTSLGNVASQISVPLAELGKIENERERRRQGAISFLSGNEGEKQKIIQTNLAILAIVKAGNDKTKLTEIATFMDSLDFKNGVVQRNTTGDLGNLNLKSSVFNKLDSLGDIKRKELGGQSGTEVLNTLIKLFNPGGGAFLNETDKEKSLKEYAISLSKTSESAITTLTKSTRDSNKIFLSGLNLQFNNFINGLNKNLSKEKEGELGRDKTKIDRDVKENNDIISSRERIQNKLGKDFVGFQQLKKNFKDVEIGNKGDIKVLEARKLLEQAGRGDDLIGDINNGIRSRGRGSSFSDNSEGINSVTTETVGVKEQVSDFEKIKTILLNKATDIDKILLNSELDYGPDGNVNIGKDSFKDALDKIRISLEKKGIDTKQIDKIILAARNTDTIDGKFRSISDISKIIKTTIKTVGVELLKSGYKDIETGKEAVKSIGGGKNVNGISILTISQEDIDLAASSIEQTIALQRKINSNIEEASELQKQINEQKNIQLELVKKQNEAESIYGVEITGIREAETKRGKEKEDSITKALTPEEFEIKRNDDIKAEEQRKLDDKRFEKEEKNIARANRIQVNLFNQEKINNAKKEREEKKVSAGIIPVTKEKRNNNVNNIKTNQYTEKEIINALRRRVEILLEDFKNGNITRKEFDKNVNDLQTKKKELLKNNPNNVLRNTRESLLKKLSNKEITTEEFKNLSEKAYNNRDRALGNRGRKESPVTNRSDDFIPSRTMGDFIKRLDEKRRFEERSPSGTTIDTNDKLKGMFSGFQDIGKFVGGMSLASIDMNKSLNEVGNKFNDFAEKTIKVFENIPTNLEVAGKVDHNMNITVSNSTDLMSEIANVIQTVSVDVSMRLMEQIFNNDPKSRFNVNRNKLAQVKSE
jgi:gas vesicle protein